MSFDTNFSKLLPSYQLCWIKLFNKIIKLLELNSLQFYLPKYLKRSQFLFYLTSSVWGESASVGDGGGGSGLGGGGVRAEVEVVRPQHVPELMQDIINYHEQSAVPQSAFPHPPGYTSRVEVG